VSEHVSSGQETPRRLERLLLDHTMPPDAPLIRCGDENVSRAELTESAFALARVLTECGVGTGEPVVYIVGRGATAVAAMFGVWLAGAVYVPLNGRHTEHELIRQLQESAPAIVIADAATCDLVPAGYTCVLADAVGQWRVIRTGLPLARTALPADAALLMRTSGTVSKPKAVVLRHEGVLAGIDTVVDRIRGSSTRRRSDDRPPQPNLIPTSLALWAGVWNTIFAMRISAPVVVMDRFETLQFAEIVRTYGITSSILAPAMMSMLVEDERITDLSPLRIVRSISAPLSPVQARRFHERFGVMVLNSYGQTELGSEIAGWTTRDIREYGDRKLGAVGRVHPGIGIKVLDEEGRALGVGESGEIFVSSPFSVLTEQSTGFDQDRIADGFLRTGDIGYLDEDGFIWVEGRVSDMINRGGLKVVPGEVEEALRELPDIQDACVAGIPDPRLGEVPVAWVIAAQGRAVEPLTVAEQLRQTLAGYKIPIDFRIVDGDFPRSEIGKVLRRELVQQYVPIEETANS